MTQRRAPSSTTQGDQERPPKTTNSSLPTSSSLPGILASLVAPAYDSIGLVEATTANQDDKDNVPMHHKPLVAPPLVIRPAATADEQPRTDARKLSDPAADNACDAAHIDSELLNKSKLDSHSALTERDKEAEGAPALNQQKQTMHSDKGDVKPSSRVDHSHLAYPPPSQDGKLVLDKYTLYETKTKLYILATNQADLRYKVLKIDRTAPLSRNSTANDDDPDDPDYAEETNDVVITEDPTVYSSAEVQELVDTLTAGNPGTKRSEPVFYGIAGFVRFTSAYYMIMIKARQPVALIGGHYIYHCEGTALHPVTPPAGSKNAEEARQMASFQGVDLSKNFYFSYTYDITHTLQYNTTRHPDKPGEVKPALAYLNDKWVWNRHLLRPAFVHLKGRSPWVLPLIYGFVDQAKLSIFGRMVYITIIARRSRHFAGARFLKRGVNDQGFVANDVETEQIVSEALTTPFHAPAHHTHLHKATGVQHQNRRPNPRYTSFVQVRGSIPLFWSQESVNMSPKPPIELTIADPFYSAAALHFDDLLGRYGSPVTVLNLIKQKERNPRESKLLPEFKQCIDYLNQFLPQEHRIHYIAWDIAAANKQRDKDVIGILEDIAEETLERTNFFHSGPEPSWYALNQDPDAPPYRDTPLLQNGVVRTNCIDCLDRTNAAQFVIAKAAMGHQLHALGVIHDPLLPFDSDAVNLITEMYHDHGDTIALQYGGSHLVNTMETYRKIGQWSSHSRDMIENLRRYYTNSFVDADKQAAIDLFLGIEPPVPRVPAYDYNPPTARRSYRDWFTSEHLQPVMTPAEAQHRLLAAIENEDDGTLNYWQYYYRPKLFTTLERHFAYMVNSSLKYKTAASGPEMPEHSPFVPRLSPFAAPPPPKPVGPVRRWASRKGARHTNGSAPTTALASAKRQGRISAQQALAQPSDPNAPAPLPSSTEGIVARLLNPRVDPLEQAEYGSWLGQFDNLSLAQDLSDKDALLYDNSVRAATGELVANPDGVALYQAVCASTPQLNRH
ncbi:phosphatidylinositol-3,5-bisphosphate 5-phosphatase [Microbotryomycetes sp. JL221]|nr:phosphatidylinositol-3,5-bisphosphate 5-phosphatase [Microbotryomycetes sp. JL221]